VTPKLVIAVVVIGFAVFLFRMMRNRIADALHGTILSFLDAVAYGYFYYLIVAILLDLSAFETWHGVARIFIFSGSLHGGEYLGITCGIIIAFFRLSTATTPFQKEPITEYVGGRRLLSHGMALRVANAMLFNRARREKKKLPHHMKEGVRYTNPDNSELDAMEPVEEVRNNLALTAYVSEDDELDTVQWGMLRIPYSETENHFLVVGTTGSGKTILLRQLMRSVLGKIKKKDDFRAFVYDNKPDFMPFARSLGLEQYVWNLDPFDPNACVWDIAKDVTDQATAKQVTEVLVPVDTGLKEPFFQQAVHGLFEAVLIRLREVAGDNWTLRDAIVVFDFQHIVEKFLTSEQTARLADSFIKAGRSYRDVRASIRAKLRPYDIAAALWSKVTDKKKYVSVNEWSKTNKILVVTHRDNFEKAIKPINQAIFRMVSLTLLSRFDSLTRSSWVFMDEIREIGVLQGYHALANKGRSKGVRLAIGFQTIEGLIAEHKDANAAYELANVMGNKTFLHSNSDITCAWEAKHVGSCDVNETVFSHSTTWSSSPSSSVSQTTKTERKQILDASHFEENLKKVTPESGLTAVNKVSSIGAYVSWVPFEWIEKNCPRTPNTEEDEKTRPPTDQEIKPWNLEDLKRLGLPEDFLIQDPPDDLKPKSKDEANDGSKKKLPETGDGYFESDKKAAKKLPSKSAGYFENDLKASEKKVESTDLETLL